MIPVVDSLDRPPQTRARRSLAALVAALALAGGLTGTAHAAIGATLVSAAEPVPMVSIDAGADTEVVEGSALKRSIAIVDGADNGAPGWNFAIDYGDGSAVVTGSTLTPSVELDHVYVDGPATRTVSVSAVDAVGLIDEVAIDSFAVSVLNSPPTPLLTGNPASAEGATYSLNVGGTDPAGASDPLEYSIDWGDGTISAPVLVPVGTIAHVFADDDDGPLDVATRVITVGLFDGDAFVTTTFPVQVTNVVPTIALTGAVSVQVGAPYSLELGEVTDPGRDTVVSRVIHWGDGSAETVASGGLFTHTYATAGARTVTVDLVDEDGTFAAAGSLPVDITAAGPSAPTNLTATPVSKSSLWVRWTNAATPQSSVVVERCKGPGCTSFTRIVTLPGTATRYKDTGLRARTTYRYRLRAKSATASSPYTVIVSARTL